MKERRINHRVDEPENSHAFQITFRTTERQSGEWSSLRGLCKRFGRDEKTHELFKEVILPAMRAYVAAKGYIEKAKAAREEASRQFANI